MTATNLRNAQSASKFANAASSTCLLTKLIDYAGLFPPAALDMAASVANYNEYLHSPWSWMLGRFIVPVAKLEEFESALNQLPFVHNEPRPADWQLSVLLGGDVSADITKILKFKADMKRRSGAQSEGRPVNVQAIEMKVANKTEIQCAAKAAPPGLHSYFEIPPDDESCYATLAATGSKAKLRTGGETSDKFPSSENVVAFIQRCLSVGVPFKATAGLHHPMRSVHRYTYEPDSPSGAMHGFINVFLAAAFLRAGLGTELTTELLEEKSVGAIQFNAEGVVWRGHRLRNDELSSTRTEFALSFGSCSFIEPVQDLLKLGLI